MVPVSGTVRHAVTSSFLRRYHSVHALLVHIPLAFTSSSATLSPLSFRNTRETSSGLPVYFPLSSVSLTHSKPSMRRSLMTILSGLEVTEGSDDLWKSFVRFVPIPKEASDQQLSETEVVQAHPSTYHRFRSSHTPSRSAMTLAHPVRRKR